jgi:hypothetical protein
MNLRIFSRPLGLLACHANKKVMNFSDYELNGTVKYPLLNGPRKARNNFFNLVNST